MAHFAEVDPSTNTVIRVLVVDQDFINTGSLGDPNRWIQTSYNTRGGVHYGTAANGSYLPDGGTALRGNYAGRGHEYHKDIDAFIAPLGNNWPSWTVSTETYSYQAPITMPTDANTANGEYYEWNEDLYNSNNSLGWIKVYGIPFGG